MLNWLDGLAFILLFVVPLPIIIILGFIMVAWACLPGVGWKPFLLHLVTGALILLGIFAFCRLGWFMKNHFRIPGEGEGLALLPSVNLYIYTPAVIVMNLFVLVATLAQWVLRTRSRQS